MEIINSWDKIQWAEINTRVFRLQTRIYKASLEGHIEKVHKLQKLLIHSESAKFLAIRKVTQDNKDRHTAGIDGLKDLSPSQRYKLTSEIQIDGTSSVILRLNIPKSSSGIRPLGIPIIKDRVKQMLVNMALSPQWEAKFESGSYGFRPGRSVNDAMDAVFLSISKKPKWVLDADIEKCFDRISHDKLLDKCETFPLMRKQLRSWLKAGIMEEGTLTFPKKGTPLVGSICPLLSNIALHGLQDKLDNYASSFPGNKRDNQSALSYVRYADDFLVMHTDILVLKGAIPIVSDFLMEMDLKLSPTKTSLAHTYESEENSKLGFTFLGFDVIQREKYIRMRKGTTKPVTEQKFITLITPSKEGIKDHKQKLKDIIRKSRGSSQENLIYQLSPVIRGWALSKNVHISSKIFAELDNHVFTHLWNWACRRHPTMPHSRIKTKYWHTVGSSNWVFAKYKEEGELITKLERHSNVHIKRFVKVKGSKYPYDGDHNYWVAH